MQIIYEPHPVTPERKAELRKAGYKILDAVFSPDGVQSAAKEDKPKRGRPAKAVIDAAGN